jgi:hypothetical protein
LPLFVKFLLNRRLTSCIRLFWQMLIKVTQYTLQVVVSVFGPYLKKLNFRFLTATRRRKRVKLRRTKCAFFFWPFSSKPKHQKFRVALGCPNVGRITGLRIFTIFQPTQTFQTKILPSNGLTSNFELTGKVFTSKCTLVRIEQDWTMFSKCHF